MKKNAGIKNIYPLTPMQEGMLFHHTLNVKSPAYHEQVKILINGNLDVDLFEKSINIIIDRYDIFRTVFIIEKTKRPVQVVLDKRNFKVTYENISNATLNEKDLLIGNYLKEDQNAGFNLAKNMLIRIKIFKTGALEYNLIWSFHHMIMDGWSLGIVTNELFKTYQLLLSGRELKLPCVNSYGNYIRWFEQVDKKGAREYWRNLLLGYKQQAIVPVCSKKSLGNEFIHAKMELQFDEQITSKLKELSNRTNVTLSTLMKAVWGILLQRYNNIDDVVFGSVFSGRTPEIAGIESMVGLFVNTVPVRIKCKKGQTFYQLLKRVQDESLEGEKHGYFPLYEIQSLSKQKQGLINSLFVFENYPLDETVAKTNGENNQGFIVRNMEIIEQTSYDFNIIVIPGSKLTLRFSYNASLHEHSFLKCMQGHVDNIIKTIIENPNVTVEDIEILTVKEKRQISDEFNNTDGFFPKNKKIHHLFEDRVLEAPDNIALQYDDFKMTYRELNERSNQLARYLIDNGVKEDIIAIMIDRSFQTIVGIMAILKSGGAYLPIDSRYPDERINYILQDSNTRFMLTTRSQNEKVKGLQFEGSVIYVDDDLNQGDCSNIDIQNESDSLAYVIYTSGSTGKPKGVMINHTSVVNIVTALQEHYPVYEDDAYLFKTTYTFDVSVAELFGWFHKNGRLVILKNGEEKDPVKILEAIRKYNITHINFVPSMLGAFLDSLEPMERNTLNKLKYIFAAGETLSKELAAKLTLITKEVSLINLYGPTEATIYATEFAIKHDQYVESIPIGKPLKNVRAYIINKNYQLQPVGVAGELCLAGNGLAKGYLNNDELTALKFIGNPFESGEFLYRTGDLAKWNSDGNIEFLGRIDHQIKIRGYRIELGEIESILSGFDKINQAVVTVKENKSGDKQLCAYFTSKEQLSIEIIHDYLSKLLPEYMIPSGFIQMEKLPLVASGKIDRNALPEPWEMSRKFGEFSPPRNKLEEEIVHTWVNALGIAEIGIDDSFFELGGDSIKAIQVMARLRSSNLKISLKDLFQYPTIRELSPRVKQLESELDEGDIEGQVELTPIQKWFFEKRLKDIHHFNQAVMIDIDYKVAEDAIMKIFDEIVSHHDVLRAIFKFENVTVLQKIRNSTEGQLFDFKVINLVNIDNYVQIVEQEANKLQSSIDLEQGPLVKVCLFKTVTRHHLLVIMHHLIIDGVSWRIILDDLRLAFSQLASGQPINLGKKTVSYKKWALKLREYANNVKLLNEMEYWKAVEETEFKNTPKDNYSETNYLLDSSNISKELTKSETESLLKNVNHAYRTEINDILLTAVALAINEWTKEDKVLIDIEGHGREILDEELDISKTVGWFTSIYPIILKVNSSKDLSYNIRMVKEQIRSIPNKGLGYGVLKYLTLPEYKQNMGFNLKPEICFNFLGQVDNNLNSGIFSISDLPTGIDTSMQSERLHSINITGIIIDGELKVTFDYCSSEYREYTVENLATTFIRYLKNIIEHCKEKRNLIYTPDFEISGLNIEDLESILETTGMGVKKIYTLSPMQKNILYDCIRSKNPNAYLVQHSISVNGDFDLKALQSSFTQIVNKYDIFKTCFLYEKLKKPYQIVLTSIDISNDICFHDISSMDKCQTLKTLEIIKEKDRNKGFDFSKGHLMRMTLVKKGEESYEIIWSFHHILMDGWCLGIIEKDFFEIYLKYKKQIENIETETFPYQNYIKWQEKTNRKDFGKFWADYLEGSHLTSLLEIPRQNNIDDYLYQELEMKIDSQIINKLSDFAKKNQISLSIIFQAVWSILLQQYSGSKDIIFGLVVSGRPPELEGIEQMVGLFINMIPVRIKYIDNERFIDLAKNIQRSALEIDEYKYYPVLDDFQGERRIFDHVIFYENYPLNKGLEVPQASGIAICHTSIYEQTSYDLNIIIEPLEKFVIKFTFNEFVYDMKFMKSVQRKLADIIRVVVENPNIILKCFKLRSTIKNDM